MNIHFVGIGGIGTSSIAQILHHRGHKVSGSDTTASSITRSLKLSGIKVTIGHTEKNITKKLDKVIYSPAIPPTNPELKKANALKIETISYPQALGDLSKKYFTIAVSGAHGKSTTTAMISLIAKNAGLDPSVVIGTKIPQFKNKNYRVGDSNLLIVEACEYKRSFLHLHPDILLITNIEAEHLDYYKNLKDYIHAFSQIAKKSKRIIIDPTNKNSKTAIKGLKKEIIHIDKTTHVTPSLPGKFNITNATFAATAAKLLNIDPKIIQNSIHSFKGTWRRLEYKKTKFKTTFIDDYGHHPTEIELTLNAI
ncbi:MAG: Mur ligase domain-containing protein, partial [Candidatus Peregrinibacteria bacterium]